MSEYELVELAVSFTSKVHPLPVGDSLNILKPKILSYDGASSQSNPIILSLDDVATKLVGVDGTGFKVVALYTLPVASLPTSVHAETLKESSVFADSPVTI